MGSFISAVGTMTLRISFIGGVFILLIFKAAGQVGGNNGEITFTFSTSENENRCSTVGGKVTRQPCVFPFKYQNKTYQKCTTVNDPDNKPWCSVATDDQGKFIFFRKCFLKLDYFLQT